MTKLIDSEFPFSQVKNLLDERGLKIKWLATACGVSPEYMGRVLKGVCNPSNSLRILMATSLSYEEAKLVEALNHAA